MSELSRPISSVALAARQPWLSSMRWDCAFIIGPSFLTAVIVLLFREQFAFVPTLPLWAWVSFVLLIDVAHVYATLFRTYLHPEARQKNRALLTVIPTACWAVGAILYSFDGLLFWRTLAYLAVFHFIRQQFGFLMLYARKEPESFARYRWLDALAIYAATVYPLLFWHTHLPRNFDWFVSGDFIAVNQMAAPAGLAAYAMIMLAYAFKETVIAMRTRYFNVPRNLILLGTALSWWVGIITVDSDLSFTMTNVISHGVPYMALVWLYHHVEHPSATNAQIDKKVSESRQLQKFALKYVAVFIVFLWLLAFVEEGLWDGLVWREHVQIFRLFYTLPHLIDNHWLTLVVPFLALPQSVHYVLDGFIWRVKDRSNVWSA